MQVSSEFRNRTARDLSGNLKYENAEADTPRLPE